jgi:Glyoxalase-like domain
MVSAIQVVVDCARPQQQAEFWAAALGYVVQPPPPGYDTWPDLLREMGVPEDQWDSRSAVVDPDGGRPRIFFQRVPEAKAVKNRVHLDIQVGAGVAAAERPAVVRDEVTRLTGLGARQERVFDEMGEHWVVMTDPEGNEFCVS